MNMDRVLNIGCGFKKFIGAVNVDSEDCCDPDVVWDLNKTPWPFEDNEFDTIYAHHIFEHLTNWWGAFEECGRILKPGGRVEIRVPDESSSSAMAYIDHVQTFTAFSFHGAHRGDGKPFRHGTNAWASKMTQTVPLLFISWFQIPFHKYEWMRRWCPWLLRFIADHMRNFIHEQVFIFEKINGKNFT